MGNDKKFVYIEKNVQPVRIETNKANKMATVMRSLISASKAAAELGYDFEAAQFMNYFEVYTKRYRQELDIDD